MTDQELEKAVKYTKRIIVYNELFKSVSPFDESHNYLAEALLHLHTQLKAKEEKIRELEGAVKDAERIINGHLSRVITGCDDKFEEWLLQIKVLRYSDKHPEIE